MGKSNVMELEEIEGIWRTENRNSCSWIRLMLYWGVDNNKMPTIVHFEIPSDDIERFKEVL